MKRREANDVIRGWFLRQRMNWMVESLYVFGFLRREHLQRKFGISVPQASADFQLFMRLYPGRMQYDLSRKMYVAVGLSTSGSRNGINKDS
jgi:hypothetical protein